MSEYHHVYLYLLCERCGAKGYADFTGHPLDTETGPEFWQGLDAAEMPLCPRCGHEMLWETAPALPWTVPPIEMPK
jgi:hypothetical protein